MPYRSPKIQTSGIFRQNLSWTLVICISFLKSKRHVFRSCYRDWLLLVDLVWIGAQLTYIPGYLRQHAQLRARLLRIVEIQLRPLLKMAVDARHQRFYLLLVEISIQILRIHFDLSFIHAWSKFQFFLLLSLSIQFFSIMLFISLIEAFCLNLHWLFKFLLNAFLLWFFVVPCFFVMIRQKSLFLDLLELLISRLEPFILFHLLSLLLS